MERGTTKIQNGAYTFARSPARLFPFEIHLNAFMISHLFTWSLWLLHISVHFALALILQRERPEVPWQLWVALIGELVFSIPEALTACTITLALCSGKAAQPRPCYRICGHVAPSVDVMITCCGEPAAIIINTIAAAAAQNYPAGRLRIFVLDDGHDAELQYAVENLILKLQRHEPVGPPVIYLSRTVAHGELSYFKSGNLRFGIEQSQQLGTASEFLAGLDADVIPEPDWLRRMVPHLLLQDKVALACGPQRYYNVPPSDPLGQQSDFDVYFTVQEVLNDCLGAPMCTGTGYVAKRSAIAQIGGWPLAFTGEDYMCSALLTGAGWDVIFVREPLQAGLAPESLAALVKQRMRWTDAGLEVHHRLRGWLPGVALTSRMKLSVRVVNMIYVIRDYSPVLTVLAVVLVPFVLIPNSDADDNFTSVNPQHRAKLYWAQRLFGAAHLARTLQSYITYSHVGLPLVANFRSQELWSAPYSAYRNLLPLLPLPARVKVPNFAVMGAITSFGPTNERSPHKRAPFVSRILRIDILAYALYTLYASIPLVARLYQSSSYQNPATPFLFPSLLLRLLACVVSMSKPVFYMIWPPTAPRWEELVVEGADGVKRPRRRREGSLRVEDRLGMAWMVGFFVEVYIIWLCWLP